MSIQLLLPSFSHHSFLPSQFLSVNVTNEGPGLNQTSDITLLTLLASVVSLIVSMQRPSHVESLHMYSTIIIYIYKQDYNGSSWRCALEIDSNLRHIHSSFMQDTGNSHITEVSQELL